NSWKGYRSVVSRDASVDFGLMGASIMCEDSVIQLVFQHHRTDVRPGFCKVRIFHNKGELPFELNFGSDEILITNVEHNPAVGYTEIEFSDKLDSLDIQFSRTISQPINLEIYGLQLMNNDPGISYTS